jgi:hypothetical protein
MLRAQARVDSAEFQGVTSQIAVFPSVYPAYRKLFDLIFERAKAQEWSGLADLNRYPVAPS